MLRHEQPEEMNRILRDFKVPLALSDQENAQMRLYMKDQRKEKKGFFGRLRSNKEKTGYENQGGLFD